MANGSQYRYPHVPDTYAISKNFMIMDMCAINNNNNNNNGYFKVLFLRRAHSPFIKNILKNKTTTAV